MVGDALSVTLRGGARTVLSYALRVAIRSYQLLLSPVLPPSCRFLPSCSDYALEAVERHGPARGLGLAAWRLLRCHPWGGSGWDPVPPSASPRRPADGRAI